MRSHHKTPQNAEQRQHIESGTRILAASPEESRTHGGATLDLATNPAPAECPMPETSNRS
jgi:hypothetical protein